MNLIEQIKLVDWHKYTGVEYFKPKEVAPALISLVNLDDESENHTIYNRILFSIGNNHCGTYYSAIQGALEFILITSIEGKTEISKNCALEILTDLYCSFGPELTPETSHLSEELQSNVKKEIENFYNKFENMAASGNESERNRVLASDLVESIDDHEF